ncbi:MAG: hypothetical protein H7645_01245 [Candidatus Heimdallarchaeota archaeon]|nr:hypothetical protein [Candidatus Heimdallarchaeota archaeon]MCK4768941.1 hypothetical protein [Candidatus Heimdallarchaeota archaeon]
MSSTSEITDNNLKNCIAREDSNCIECELNGELICFVDKKFANKFSIGNILYRLLAIEIFIFSGLLIGHWWMLISYVSTVLITFLIIEPRLLCSHCPFYEREGKCLKCWALRGMPKLWRYRPGPINRTEKTLMLILGSFIDLFPFLGSIWGIVYFFMNIEGNIVLGVGILISTVLFLIVAGYFSKVLLGFACKKCANFSCAMNKVPKEVINKFLEKNPKMKNAWIKSGWKIEE